MDTLPFASLHAEFVIALYVIQRGYSDGICACVFNPPRYDDAKKAAMIQAAGYEDSYYGILLPKDLWLITDSIPELHI